jgi:hypothetical protein
LFRNSQKHPTVPEGDIGVIKAESGFLPEAETQEFKAVSLETMPHISDMKTCRCCKSHFELLGMELDHSRDENM